MANLSIKVNKGRRKSSTMDMFSDPVKYMQQIEKTLENVEDEDTVEVEDIDTMK
jgi:hypothetical protein